jgi:hypothetical protein
MTVQSTTLKLIDTGLIARYSGLEIPVGDPSVLTPVEIFIETPQPEEVPERTFPSISIRFLSMTPDFSDMQHCDDDEMEELYLDEDPTIPEMVTRQKGTAFRILYSLDTWHRAKVIEDRDLLFETFLRKTPIRGYLPIKNIDDEDISVWVNWTGSLVMADEADYDELIYHKSVTLTILAYLAPVSVSDIVSDKVVTKAEFEVNSVEEGVSTEDVTFEFDETTVTRLES